jgi:ethanolamine utilization protein EutP (predicted NTPase)
MSRRSEELAAALVRTQTRLRAAEKALARFVAEGKADMRSEYGKHRDLLQALATARNDIDVLERAMKAESERGFDWLAAKMAVQ